MQSMEIKPSEKGQLISATQRQEHRKPYKQKTAGSKKPDVSVLGKRKTPPQKLNSIVFEMKDRNISDNAVKTECRRLSDEEEI